MSEFGRYSTAQEVLEGIDLTGKMVFITGANSGLGKESARAMASKGAHIVMAGRDQAKLDAAVADVRAEQPDAQLDTILCDLGSLEAIRASTAEANERFEKIELHLEAIGCMA
ncbi:MAG: SDR family NAD(P)-dependent oxidoreductase, partial [Pseudomonadota bacterium]